MIKTEFKQNVVINLPPEEIFAYVSDLQNLANWSSVVISARNTSGESTQAGVTVRCTIRFLGRWFDNSFEIVESKPNCYLTIKSISGIAPCLIYYRLEPIVGGGTIVSLEHVIYLVVDFLGLAEYVVTSAVRRQVKHDLLTLKDMLEAKASMDSGTVL